jgi:sodium-dependent phosphate transporter
MTAWIYLGRIITLPMAGIIAGHLIGIVINALRWGMVEVEVEVV